MRNRYWALVMLFCLPVFLFGILVNCGGGDDDDDDDDSTPGEEDPKKYDQSMIGWAFGEGVYRYFDGEWAKEPTSPYASRIVGAHFENREFGFVFTTQHIFRYEYGEWTELTPPNYPPGVLMFDMARTGDGSYWFAARDYENNGYLVRIDPTYATAVYPLLGTISSQPVRLTAIAGLSENPALFMTAEIEGWFQLVSWDALTVETELIFEQSEEAPVEILDLTQAPDGTLWAAGQILAEGEPTGAFWHKIGEEWAYQPAVASSACSTHTVRSLHFTSDNTGYAIANCLWSQIYHSTDLVNWTEMELPGLKNENYLIQDMGMLEDTRGWVVGHTDEIDGPLLLLRDINGWQQALPLTFDEGDQLNAVVMFDLPNPGGLGDDDTTDDDTTDDDTGDDDASDDDQTDDDIVDDDTSKS